MSFGGRDDHAERAWSSSGSSHVEKNMYKSMARVIDEGARDYKSMDRPTWVTSGRAEVIILVGQM